MKRARPLVSILLILALPLACSALQNNSSQRLGAATPASEIADSLNHGNALLQTEHYDGALELFESVLRSDPVNHTARAGEALAVTASALRAKKTGDADGALVYLSRGIHWVPDDPVLLMKFSLQADSMRFYKDAEHAIIEAVKLQPNEPDIIYTLAHVQLDLQKLPQAEQTLRHYLTLRPEDASAHFGLGHLMHLLLRDEEAETELNLSLRLQPLQTESFYELGQIALARNQFSTAHINFSHVLALNPTHGGALIGMGILAYRQKNYPEAERYLTKGIIVDPASPVAHSIYSLVLSKMGKTVKAEQESAEAATLTRESTRTKAGYKLAPGPPYN